MITPPLIVVEGSDVSIYAEVAFVLGDLESIDVRREAYRVYDAAGRLVELTAEQNRVVLGMTKDEPKYRVELEAVLRRYLIAIGAPEAMTCQMSLPELLAESARFATVEPKFWKTVRQTVSDILEGRRSPRWKPAK